MKELKVGERIILEVVEVECISCQDCFFAIEGQVFEKFTFTDGTPFGMKVEE